MPPFPSQEESLEFPLSRLLWPRDSSLCREGRKTMGRFIFEGFGLLVVFLSLSETGASLCCPLRWSSYDGYCYRVFDEFRTWEEAEEFCTQQHKGSHLVSIHSTEEADFVAKITDPILKPSFLWIGVNNVWNGCNWQWSDGTNLDYKEWREQFECLVFRPINKQWFNTDCSGASAFICKFQA